MENKIKRYLLVMFILVSLVWFLLPITAFANSAPMPTLEIRVTGLDDPDDYYLDLLVSEADIHKTGSEVENIQGIEDEPIFQYSGGDSAGILCHGYKLYGVTYGELSGQQIDEGYILHFFTHLDPRYPFKIMIQDRDTGELTISETIEIEQLYSVVEYDAATKHVKVLYNFFLNLSWLVKFAFRVAVTLIIECLLVFAFSFKRNRWLPVPVNFVTQILLNMGLIILFPILFHQHYATALISMEVIIIAIEFLAYHFWMGDKKRWLKTLAYTLIANGITLAAGLWLMA